MSCSYQRLVKVVALGRTYKESIYLILDYMDWILIEDRSSLLRNVEIDMIKGIVMEKILRDVLTQYIVEYFRRRSALISVIIRSDLSNSKSSYVMTLSGFNY